MLIFIKRKTIEFLVCFDHWYADGIKKVYNMFLSSGYSTLLVVRKTIVVYLRFLRNSKGFEFVVIFISQKLHKLDIVDLKFNRSRRNREKVETTQKAKHLKQRFLRGKRQ